MNSIRKFIRKNHPLRKDVMDMLNGLADVYDDRANVNISKCQECDESNQVYAYFFAEGKTYRNTAKDLRILANSIKIK